MPDIKPKVVELEKEITTHPSKNIFKFIKCKKCKKSFSSRKLLEDHDKTKHLNIQTETPFQCKKCFRYLSSSSSLKEHFKFVHLKLIEKSCDHCPKKFRRPSQLIKHIENVHSVHRNIPKKSKNSLIITKVRSIQSSNQRYQCKLCDKSRKNRRDIKTHIKKDHSVTFVNQSHLELIKVPEQNIKKDSKVIQIWHPG